jgi:shikimate kinase
MSGEPRRPPLRIVLTGFMGAGKTTVGAELARLLGWRFLDLDAWIEAEVGKSVAEIFRERGEAAFRLEERRAALAAAQLERHVVAAGGGAFAHRETRAILEKDAVSVWLRCAFETILERVPADGVRPLALNRARMRELFEEREPFYRLASVSVDAAAGGPSEVAREVIRVLGLTTAL